eukprot:2820349-Prymnesium_polylepis.1
MQPALERPLSSRVHPAAGSSDAVSAVARSRDAGGQASNASRFYRYTVETLQGTAADASLD